MSNYLNKDEDYLQWSAIRRRLTREFDTEIQIWRERNLNKILTGARTKFLKAKESGQVIELESEYSEWVSTALDKEIRLLPTADDGE